MIKKNLKLKFYCYFIWSWNAAKRCKSFI